MRDAPVPSRLPGRLRPLVPRGDAAVNEIMGYILMFALSAVILVVSLQSFTSAKQGSEDIVASVEMRSVADRVSARLLEASKVAQEFPNATYNISLRVPADINSQSYSIEATATEVVVQSSDGAERVTASAYNLDAIPGLHVGGKVYSSEGHIVIRYEKDLLGRKWINVTGGS